MKPPTRSSTDPSDRVSDSRSPTEIFEAERARLLRVAYRMLGSWSEAEDVVQEAWLRWAKSEGVEKPAGWLHRVTSRLALDQLRSARKKREEYVGPWLPEPIELGEVVDPAERADSLSMAMLALLERLTPNERAAFLLRQVFDYAYPEVAQVVGKSEATCRQLVHRAQKHLAENRPRFQTPRAQQEDLLRRFAAAAQVGDLQPLEEWLDRDVVLYTDGGGKVLAALLPIFGAEKVTRFFVGIWPKRPPGMELVPYELNGEPALLAVVSGQPVQTMHFEFAESGLLKAIFIVRNPEKLKFLKAEAPPSSCRPAT